MVALCLEVTLTSMCVTSPGVTLTGPNPILFSQILWEFICEEITWALNQCHSEFRISFQSEFQLFFFLLYVCWGVADGFNTNLAHRSGSSAHQVLLLLVAEHGGGSKAWSGAQHSRTQWKQLIHRTIQHHTRSATACYKLREHCVVQTEITL